MKENTPELAHKCAKIVYYKIRIHFMVVWMKTDVNWLRTRKLCLMRNLLGEKHGKGLLSLKGQVRNEWARRLELGVIVCAEYSCDKISSWQCMAVELEDLKEFKRCKIIASQMAAQHEVLHPLAIVATSLLCCLTCCDDACGRESWKKRGRIQSVPLMIDREIDVVLRSRLYDATCVASEMRQNESPVASVDEYHLPHHATHQYQLLSSRQSEGENDAAASTSEWERRVKLSMQQEWRKTMLQL
jgi:hypothetical protein